MATAVQVESLWNGLTDNNGQPLAAGKVYTYNAGTTTPVSLFTSSDKSSSATNPLILDAYGKAQVWADGRYKFVVKTSADVTLYTLDNLLYGFDDTTVLYGGSSTGSANAQIVSVPATVTSYANGQTVSFVAGYTNTGATTLQFNSLSAVNLVKGPTPSSLQAGDLIAGQLYTATYHGGSFRLQDYPSVADVQRSRYETLSNVGGTNTIVGDLTPALTSYESGLQVRFKAANSNTGAATLNVNGLGAKAVQFNNAALVSGEIAQNLFHDVVYDGTQFQLLNPAFSASTRTLPASVGQVQDGDYVWLGITAGTATAQTATAAPAITSYKIGQKFRFKVGSGLGSTGNTNTAHTININSLGAKNLVNQDWSNPTLGTWVANSIVECVYDGTNFVIINDPGGILSYTPTLTGNGSMTVSSVVVEDARFIKSGKSITAWINCQFTTGGTGNTLNITMPVNATGYTYLSIFPTINFDVSTVIGFIQLSSPPTFVVTRDTAGSAWGIGANKYARFVITYTAV